MNPKLQASRRAFAAFALAAVATTALALPVNDTTGDKGVDPAARKPLLATPRPAAPPAAPVPVGPDTSALLPAGEYTLHVTLKGETVTFPVHLVRNGGPAVTADITGSADLTGTVAPDGRLALAGGNGTDRLTLAATVQNRRAQGTATLGRGAQQLHGSFTLDPATGARKLQEYGAPKNPPKEGFFDRLAKAWKCLTNWSSC